MRRMRMMMTRSKFRRTTNHNVANWELFQWLGCYVCSLNGDDAGATSHHGSYQLMSLLSLK